MKKEKKKSRKHPDEWVFTARRLQKWGCCVCVKGTVLCVCVWISGHMHTRGEFCEDTLNLGRKKGLKQLRKKKRKAR